MDMSLRVQRWFASARGAQREELVGTSAHASPPDLEAIREAMRLAMAPCSNHHRALATGQIARAGSAIELWLLRASLYQYLAQDLGQSVATLRCAALLPLFKDAVPGNVPGRRIGDNDAHGQRFH